MKTATATKTARRPAKKTAASHHPTGKRWSADVTAHSDALTLEDGVFTRSAKEIAASVKRSAEKSKRRKSTPFRSAMSMLTFYENRAGKNLSAAKQKKLMQAKEELRKLFHREATMKN